MYDHQISNKCMCRAYSITIKMLFLVSLNVIKKRLTQECVWLLKVWVLPINIAVNLKNNEKSNTFFVDHIKYDTC